MNEKWIHPTTGEGAPIRGDMAPDRVAQLMEERNALMAKVREIDDQMNAIGEMVAKWAEIAKVNRTALHMCRPKI